MRSIAMKADRMKEGSFIITTTRKVPSDLVVVLEEVSVLSS